MALKNNWNDLVDGESFVEVEPINRIAHAIIANEENILSVQKLSESIQSENKSQEAEINELSKDLTRFESDAVRLDSKINENKKRITNLEMGIPSDLFLTDNSIAYSKNVPQNALPYAEVRKIGGKTRKCTNLAQVNTVPFPAKDKIVIFEGKISGDVVLSWKHNLTGLATTTAALFSWEYEDGTAGYDVAIGNSKGYVFIANKTVTQIFVRNWCGATGGSVYDIMLNQGTTALPYEPYFDGLRSAPVTEVESVGVNLFDPAPIGTKTFIGLTYTTEDGYVKINGTKINGANIHPMTEPKITLPAGTYTVSVRMISGTVSGIEGTGGVFFGINKNSYSQRTTPGVSKVGDVGVRTFTLSEPTLITSFDIAPDYGSVGAVFSNAVFACQFERANTAGNFKPYTHNTLPIPEAVQALDGYGDGVNESVYNYIDLDKKQFVKRVGEVVFDGSADEQWMATPSCNTADYNAFYTRQYANNAHKTYGGVALCDKLSCMTYGELNAENVSGFFMGDVSDKQIIVRVPNTITTDAEMRTWIVENPLTIYYELATPVVTDISDLVSEDNFIGVEGNGTITMINQYKYNVPSEIVFMLDEV